MALFDLKPKTGVEKPQIRVKKVKARDNPFDMMVELQGNDLKIAEKIRQRRLQMLVHSSLYYDFDSSIVTDRQFDLWAYELMDLQTKYPQIADKVCYNEAFKGWDASTGAFLPTREMWVINKAMQILEINRRK